MKKVLNKTFMAIVLAFAMALALVGSMIFVNHTEVAEAADKPLTIKIEAKAGYSGTDGGNTDIKSFAKGSSFIVKITVSSIYENYYFDSLTLNIGPLVSTKDAFDETKCSYLTFVPYTARANFKKSANINSTKNFTDNSRVYTAANDFSENGLVLISLANFGGIALSCSDEITLEFELTVSEDVPEGTDFEFGVLQTRLNGYTYRTDLSDLNSIWIYANDTDNFEVQPLTFTVKEPSNDNNLSNIKVGQDETDLTEIDFSDPSNLAITVTDITKPILVLPSTSDENATVLIKKTNDEADEGTSVESGTIGTIEIPEDGQISIIVTAENGETKTYTLNVTVVGAKITALVVNTDSSTEGAKQGLAETFDSATFDYTVDVPNDSTKITINATVSTGNSALSSISLSKTGSCTIPPSAESATDFNVTDIADGDKLTLTVKADNNGGITSEKSYTLTFNVSDVDTAITLTVVGSTTNKTFENNEAKAADNNVNYYYVIAGETNASSKITITYPTTAEEVILDGSAYTVTTTLTGGEHTVRVTAQAGNVTEYKFYLKNYMAIQLKSDVVTDFMFEEITSTNIYRRTYKEVNKKHGVDDLDFDRIVIGQIADKTSINAFLENFETGYHSSIKLYNANGELVYDCGSAAGSYTSDDLSDYAKAIGTSWKLEYVVDGNVEETIYLSVLGDLNGDGIANAVDISSIGNVIQKSETALNDFNNNVEKRLACYISNNLVNNNGTAVITAAEIPYLGNHIRMTVLLSEMFYTGS